jgi:hypothetical protein
MTMGIRPTKDFHFLRTGHGFRPRQDRRYDIFEHGPAASGFVRRKIVVEESTIGESEAVKTALGPWTTF